MNTNESMHSNIGWLYHCYKDKLSAEVGPEEGASRWVDPSRWWAADVRTFPSRCDTATQQQTHHSLYRLSDFGHLFPGFTRTKKHRIPGFSRTRIMHC